MENKQLAERIKKECSIKGITLNKMYKDLNIPNSFTSDLKSKDKTPSIKRVEEIAEYFNVSIDYLIGREEKGNTYIANQGNIKGNNTQNINSKNNELEPLEQELINQFRKYSKIEQLEVLKELEQRKNRLEP